MAASKGKSFFGRWGVHLAVLAFVVLWTIPTLGILISSLRDEDQIAVSGWWTAWRRRRKRKRSAFRLLRLKPRKTASLSSRAIFSKVASARSALSEYARRSPPKYPVGTVAELDDGVTLQVNADGSFVMSRRKHSRANAAGASISPRQHRRDLRRRTDETVLFSEGIGRSFINSLTVTIPATIIPILIAAFAAYALAWMRFPGRALLIAVIIGLLVVPLQMSLIPLLEFYNGVGAFFGVPAKTYLGIWLAHTGFGLPFAIYLLRSYIAGLPREIMESARIDGASDFEIFVKIVLPLSFPVLASFAIFQFLWVWNDLLVAMVFLRTDADQLVLTAKLDDLLGSRGGDWEILTTSAFVTIIVPLVVFFSLQRYFVRGLLAGSVKGG